MLRSTLLGAADRMHLIWREMMSHRASYHCAYGFHLLRASPQPPLDSLAALVTPGSHELIEKIPQVRTTDVVYYREAFGISSVLAKEEIRIISHILMADASLSPVTTLDGDEKFAVSFTNPPNDQETAITPRSFLITRVKRFNKSVRIFDLSRDLPPLYREAGSKPELITNEKPRLGRSTPPVDQDAVESKTGEGALADYFVHSFDGGYTLYEGPGPLETSRPSLPVMEIGGEGCWQTVSDYTEVGQEGRSTQMYKDKAPGGNPWWSLGRTLKDFEGNTYKWKNSCLGDLTCVRADSVEVAHLKRHKLSFSEVGTLELKESVPQSLFYLVLASCFIKWKEDHQRRQRAAALAAIAAAS